MTEPYGAALSRGGRAVRCMCTPERAAAADHRAVRSLLLPPLLPPQTTCSPSATTPPAHSLRRQSRPPSQVRARVRRSSPRRLPSTCVLSRTSWMLTSPASCVDASMSTSPSLGKPTRCASCGTTGTCPGSTPFIGRRPPTTSARMSSTRSPTRSPSTARRGSAAARSARPGSPSTSTAASSRCT